MIALGPINKININPFSIFNQKKDNLKTNPDGFIPFGDVLARTGGNIDLKEGNFTNAEISNSQKPILEGIAKLSNLYNFKFEEKP